MARAAGGIALLPVRAFDYAMCREPLVDELASDLSSRPAAPDPVPCFSSGDAGAMPQP
jgi:hypothetical protein